MRLSTIAVALVLCGLSAHGFAEDDYSSAYSACMDKSGGVTFDMIECSNDELSLQDSRLNIAYKNAMEVLEGESKTKLREAQRLWIEFRDANCGIYYNLSGGTMDSLNGVSCELDMTKERADALEWIYLYGE